MANSVRINDAYSSVISVMPHQVVDEIERLCRARGVTTASINEIRLRAIGLCGAVINGVNFTLKSRVDAETIQNIFKKICDMAIYAHREDIINGFVSMSGGCRVGVCGHARYDGGKLVGVSGISSLVFRIPNGVCDFADELFKYWKERNFCGMLICSPAGVGKTSAIRALVAKAGRMAKRIVAVDERCELDLYAYRDCTVDILKGYKRALGIEIAVRTMSAEILVVDEIGNESDADALMLAIGAGVPVVATAHGEDIRKVTSKPSIKKLCAAGLFDSFAVISIKDGIRRVSIGEFPIVDDEGFYTV